MFLSFSFGLPIDHQWVKATSYMTPLLHPSTINTEAPQLFRDINNMAALRSLVKEMERDFLQVQFAGWKRELWKLCSVTGGKLTWRHWAFEQGMQPQYSPTQDQATEWWIVNIVFWLSDGHRLRLGDVTASHHSQWPVIPFLCSIRRKHSGVMIQQASAPCISSFSGHKGSRLRSPQSWLLTAEDEVQMSRPLSAGRSLSVLITPPEATAPYHSHLHIMTTCCTVSSG